MNESWNNHTWTYLFHSSSSQFLLRSREGQQSVAGADVGGRIERGLTIPVFTTTPGVTVVEVEFATLAVAAVTVVPASAPLGAVAGKVKGVMVAAVSATLGAEAVAAVMVAPASAPLRAVTGAVEGVLVAQTSVPLGAVTGVVLEVATVAGAGVGATAVVSVITSL